MPESQPKGIEQHNYKKDIKWFLLAWLIFLFIPGINGLSGIFLLLAIAAAVKWQLQRRKVHQ